jgi:hypothetical protein
MKKQLVLTSLILVFLMIVSYACAPNASKSLDRATNSTASPTVSVSFIPSSEDQVPDQFGCIPPVAKIAYRPYLPPTPLLTFTKVD